MAISLQPNRHWTSNLSKRRRRNGLPYNDEAAPWIVWTMTSHQPRIHQRPFRSHSFNGLAGFLHRPLSTHLPHGTLFSSPSNRVRLGRAAFCISCNQEPGAPICHKIMQLRLPANTHVPIQVSKHVITFVCRRI